MNQNILSRSACNALRGLAIIGIFLHNYCHWLGPIVKENEYQFFQHNTDWLNILDSTCAYYYALLGQPEKTPEVFREHRLSSLSICCRSSAITECPYSSS